MSLNIQLPKFEGPMALLLYLIRKEEMDIMDIKIHLITAQYFEYIKLMKELDLEIAGEFISMASTLIHIKSRMLLPTYDENGEIVESEDPRKELVQRLLEYQKFQEASKALYERPILGRDIFPRGFREKLDAKEDEIVLEDNALFSLISAYRTAMKGVKKKVHQVAAKAQSIASRILEIRDRLILGTRVGMSDLIDAATEKKKQVLITFLSLLELGKLGFVSLYQTENFQEIYIETKKLIETNAVDRVEEYDSLNTEEVAQRMMEKAAKLTAEELANIDQEVERSADTIEEAQKIQVDLADSTPSAEGSDDFILPDEKDEESLGFENISIEEMASDDDILAAEAELDGRVFTRPSEGELYEMSSHGIDSQQMSLQDVSESDPFNPSIQENSEPLMGENGKIIEKINDDFISGNFSDDNFDRDSVAGRIGELNSIELDSKALVNANNHPLENSFGDNIQLENLSADQVLENFELKEMSFIEKPSLELDKTEGVNLEANVENHHPEESIVIENHQELIEAASLGFEEKPSLEMVNENNFLLNKDLSLNEPEAEV